MAYVYQKALSSQLWLNGTLGKSAPQLFSWSAESSKDGADKAALLLTDVMFNDISLLAEAESYRPLSLCSYLLLLCALGLMFREVQISGLGGLVTLVLLVGIKMVIVPTAVSARSLAIDRARGMRLSEASRQLTHFAALKLLLWHEPVLSKYSLSRLDALFENDVAENSSVMISEGVVMAMVTSVTGFCSAFVVIFELYVEKNETMTSFELYMVLSLAACMVTPLMIIMLAHRHAARCARPLERVVRFLGQKDEVGAGREPVKSAKQKLPQAVAIQAEKCVFEWAGDEKDASSRYTLGEDSDSVTLNVRKGELVGVVGSTGHGKSSLLHALSGNMPRKQGVLLVDGEVAYSAQMVHLLARATLCENIIFGLPFDPAMYLRALECTHCQEMVADLLPKGSDAVRGSDSLLGEEVERSTLHNSDDDVVILTQTQLVLVGLARAVYKDASIYLLDGVFDALGSQLAELVFADCILKQLGLKTVVLAESHAIAALPSSLLEACNMVHLIGARRSEVGVVSGLVGHGELAIVQQQSDRWHQRHDLDLSVCSVLSSQAVASSWLLLRMGQEEATLANAQEQSDRWAWCWFIAKSHESLMVGMISFVVLLSHALRALQDWWLMQLYSGKLSGDMAVDGIDQNSAAVVLIASVICSTFLFCSANSLWAAIVSGVYTYVYVYSHVSTRSHARAPLTLTYKDKELSP